MVLLKLVLFLWAGGHFKMLTANDVADDVSCSLSHTHTDTFTQRVSCAMGHPPLWVLYVGTEATHTHTHTHTACSYSHVKAWCSMKWGRDEQVIKAGGGVKPLVCDFTSSRLCFIIRSRLSFSCCSSHVVQMFCSRLKRFLIIPVKCRV